MRVIGAATYQADKLSLNVTGKIFAKYGKNYLNIKSLSVTDEIDGNAGHNNIATSSDFSSGTIKARWDGSNTIIIGGNVTIASVSAGDGGSAGTNNLTFKGINNTIMGDIVINSSGSGIKANNLTLGANGTNLTLNGKSTGDTTHQITTLTATTSGVNTLTLDNTTATSGSIGTTINSVVNGQNLAVVMKGKEITTGGSSEEVALILTNTSGSTLKSVSLAEGSAGGHRLAFNAGANSVLETINIADNQHFTLDLNGDGTSLNLAGLSGATTINIKGTGAKTLSGGSIDAQSLVFDNDNTLTIKNTSADFALLDASSANTSANLTAQANGGSVLEIDSSNAGISVTTHELVGNLGIAYKGANTGTLTINGGTHTL